MSKFLGRFFLAFLSLGALGAIVVVAVGVWALYNYGSDLPDYKHLEDYKPPTVTRVHAGDGRLLAEFATETRVFMPLTSIPLRVVNAFLSAEDKNFYYHPGLDIFGVMRAIRTNIQNAGSSRRLVGASTITQQVAKNFLLTNEVSYERKIKEAILAFRIERAFTKEQILELYLNEIYLGRGTYGVAAAALKYFNKPLNQLTVEEAAYLAALPKAPNNYHPTKRYDAAVERRNWVIDRMLEDEHIGNEEAEIAKLKPLQTFERDQSRFVNTPYFAEEVRRQLKQLYGDDALYKGGLSVRSTVNPELQIVAQKALRNGLLNYDHRHGLHNGTIGRLESLAEWRKQLPLVERPPGTEDLDVAVVLDVNHKRAIVGFADKAKGIVTYNKAKWARKRLPNGYLGPVPNGVSNVLSKGDVILAQPSGEKLDDMAVYYYRQIPKIQGAIVAMDPHTGRVLAMSGGFSYEMSEFNRATQAKRQPGSAFKPFVYLTALEKGFTPATLILDAPFVMDQGAGLGKWRPSNYSGEFYGPTPFRVGIEKSRNLMTVRLANYIGMDEISKRAIDFGVVKNLDPVLSMALGAGETTLMQITTAYAMFVNGGKRLQPKLIDRIQDRDGKTIFVADGRPCKGCGPLLNWDDLEPPPVPDVPDTRTQVADPRHAYQIVSIMEGVVKRGTGVRVRDLGHPLAGKTGTTNASKDTWFIGFTPDLVVGVFVGMDDPVPLGKKETGSSVAAPIFKEFMAAALKDKSPLPFRVPDGIRHVKINAETGTRAKPGDERVIWEAFVAGSEPTDKMMMFDGTGISVIDTLNSTAGESATTGTGGLY